MPTTAEMIRDLVEAGVCRTKDDAVIMLIDMGEVSEMDEDPDVQDFIRRRDGDG